MICPQYKAAVMGALMSRDINGKNPHPRTVEIELTRTNMLQLIQCDEEECVNWRKCSYREEEHK